MISRRSLLSQMGLLAAAGTGAWWLREHVIWPAPRPVFAAGGSSGWLDFTQSHGVPIIETSAKGRPVQVLVDSGAQSSVIDRALAAGLGLATSALAPVVIAFGVSGQPRLGRTARLDVDLGDLKLQGLHAAVFDLAPIAAASGRPFGLILGQDVLKALVADLDFPGGRLAFHAPGGYAPPPQARAVTVRGDGRELFVPVTVEGKALEAVIDTGASSTLALSADAAQAAGLFDGRPVDRTVSVTFGGATHDLLVRVSSLAFAGETWRDMPVRIYAGSGAAHLPPGLMGVEAFARYRTILDVGGRRLHLAPGETSSKEGTAHE